MNDNSFVIVNLSTIMMNFKDWKGVSKKEAALLYTGDFISISYQASIYRSHRHLQCKIDIKCLWCAASFLDIFLYYIGWAVV